MEVPKNIWGLLWKASLCENRTIDLFSLTRTLIQPFNLVLPVFITASFIICTILSLFSYVFLHAFFCVSSFCHKLQYSSTTVLNKGCYKTPHYSLLMFTSFFNEVAITVNVTGPSPNICVEENTYLSLNGKLHNREKTIILICYNFLVPRPMLNIYDLSHRIFFHCRFCCFHLCKRELSQINKSSLSHANRNKYNFFLITVIPSGLLFLWGKNLQ